MDSFTTYNNLVYAIALRVKDLCHDDINTLRSVVGGEGAHSRYEAIQQAKHLDKGQLIEHIIIDEFELEFDLPIESELDK